VVAAGLSITRWAGSFARSYSSHQDTVCPSSVISPVPVPVPVPVPWPVLVCTDELTGHLRVDLPYVRLANRRLLPRGRLRCSVARNTVVAGEGLKSLHTRCSTWRGPSTSGTTAIPAAVAANREGSKAIASLSARARESGKGPEPRTRPRGAARRRRRPGSSAAARARIPGSQRTSRRPTEPVAAPVSVPVGAREP
jgi:hypothetical protein